MSDPSAIRLLALLGVRLRGRADAPEVADFMGVDLELLAHDLDEAEAAGQLVRRQGRFPGFVLTADGSAALAGLAAAERSRPDVESRLAAAYERFLELNDVVLSTCTRWQLKGSGPSSSANRHDDQAYDRAVIEDLVAVHAEALAVLAELTSVLARFGGYRSRLQNALDQVVAGDHDWFTKPMFPSYHTCWFELHEDLLVTLGRERTPEGSN